MIYRFIQTRENDCAFTCLKMLLATLNDDRNYEFLFDKKEGCYSLEEITQIAKENGTIMDGYRVRAPSFTQVNAPYILSYSHENRLHAIFVYRTSAEYIYAIDPENGKKVRINYSTDARLSEVTVLLVTESHKMKLNKKYLHKHERVVDRVISGIFEICALVSLALCLVLYTPDVIWLSLLFLGLSVLCSVLSRIYVLYMMRRFDDSIMYFFLPKAPERKKFYALSNETKSFVFVTFTQLLSSISFMFLATLLAILWSYYFAILILGIFLLCLLAEYLYRHPMTNYKKQLNQFENSIIDELHDGDFAYNRVQIRNITRKYLILETIIKTQSPFLAILFIALFSFLSGSFDLNLSLFLLALSGILASRMRYVFSYFSNQKNATKKVKLNNEINKIISTEKNNTTKVLSLEQVTGIEPA